MEAYNRSRETDYKNQEDRIGCMIDYHGQEGRTPPEGGVCIYAYFS